MRRPSRPDPRPPRHRAAPRRPKKKPPGPPGATARRARRLRRLAKDSETPDGRSRQPESVGTGTHKPLQDDAPSPRQSLPERRPQSSRLQCVQSTRCCCSASHKADGATSEADAQRGSNRHRSASGGNQTAQQVGVRLTALLAVALDTGTNGLRKCDAFRFRHDLGASLPHRSPSQRGTTWMWKCHTSWPPAEPLFWRIVTPSHFSDAASACATHLVRDIHSAKACSGAWKMDSKCAFGKTSKPPLFVDT